MNATIVIAKNTFRQAIRDKILYGILIFALLFLGSTIVLSSLSLGEDIFTIQSFGLAGIYLFGLIITFFLGASMIYDEVERKTSYFLLAKPVSRSDIILGKFLGLLGSVSMVTFLMTAAYIIIVSINGGGFNPMIFLAIALQLFEMAVLIGAIILFSVFTTPLASIIYAILILYIGHLLHYIHEFALKSDGIAKYILSAAYYVFPNLEKFNVRSLIIHNLPIASGELLISLAYAVMYSAFLLFLAGSLLNRKEL
jgi:Cu-processing system permease protein